MSNVNITINHVNYSVDSNLTVLEAARSVGISIPTLCFLKDINETSACRVCVVEVKNARSLVTACSYPVSEGMEVLTHSGKVIDSRKKTVELILSNHSKDCLGCVRNQNCELQNIT